MPQRSLHPLVYILLMWLTIISIVQVVFIAFFFTLGQSSSHRAEEPGGTTGPLVAITSTTKTNSITVLNYQAREKVKQNIKWKSTQSKTDLISDEGEQLHVKKDGYYFLNLRVTLNSCKAGECSEHTVKLQYGDEVLLEGWIDKTTHSTGHLSKVKALSVGKKLEVIIEPPPTSLNTSSKVTYLDIVFMPKLAS